MSSSDIKKFSYPFILYLAVVSIAALFVSTPLWDKMLIILFVTWIIILAILLTYFMRLPRFTVTLGWAKKISAERELALFVYTGSLQCTTLYITSFIVLGGIAMLIAFLNRSAVDFLLGSFTLGIGTYYLFNRKVVYGFFERTIVHFRKSTGGSVTYTGFNVKGAFVLLLIVIFIAALFWWGNSP